MKIRRTALVLLAAVLCLNAVSPAALIAASCDPLWVKRIITAVDNESVRPQAIRWMELFQKETDEVVARGMLRSVQARPLEEFLVTFKNLAIDDLPFPGNTVEERVREAYRSIGNLAGPDYVGVAGLDGKIGNIVSDSRSNQLGSLLDMKAADDVGMFTKPRAPGTGFEQTKVFTDANGNVIASRQYDLVDPAAGSPFGGYCHESKNWPAGWTEQAFVDQFMDEFRRDILIHSQTNFDFYRLNLRQATEPNLGRLKDLLLQQFESNLVKDNLDSGTINRVRDAFTRHWDTGPGGELVRLY